MYATTFGCYGHRRLFKWWWRYLEFSFFPTFSHTHTQCVVNSNFFHFFCLLIHYLAFFVCFVILMCWKFFVLPSSSLALFNLIWNIHIILILYRFFRIENGLLEKWICSKFYSCWIYRETNLRSWLD